MKFENALFKGMIILFLVLSSDIFSSDTIRKEVKLFSTFEDFMMNNPVKIYQTDNVYNSDKKIKSNQGLIKVIEEKTADGRTIGTDFFIPPAYHDKYLWLNEFGFKQASSTKKMVCTYNSLNNLFSRKALKIYKSRYCEADAYNDNILVFKQKPNLILVTYYYNQYSSHIYQSIYRIPKALLEAYLQKMVAMSAINLKQAKQLRQQADEYVVLKYDFENKYLDEVREQFLIDKYNRKRLVSLISDEISTEPIPVESYYIHRDAQGSTTAVTNQDGKLIERVTYGIYGAPIF